MLRTDASRLFVLAALCAVLIGCAGMVPLRESGPSGSIVSSICAWRAKASAFRNEPGRLVYEL